MKKDDMDHWFMTDFSSSVGTISIAIIQVFDAYNCRMNQGFWLMHFYPSVNFQLQIPATAASVLLIDRSGRQLLLMVRMEN